MTNGDVTRWFASFEGATSPEQRQEAVVRLSDEQLFDACRALTASELLHDDLWLPLLSSELKRRRISMPN